MRLRGTCIIRCGSTGKADLLIIADHGIKSLCCAGA